ncbi:hypothetical protein CANARDRAFT_20194 [[Candida] arabinofermentans NRRL YB-2248]|uniref:Uncharacterized protein n=1 Tax=[Candida] arabinofermentans NRRL YB-2248 TaxID=983967 RepID=A0A1E4STC6_9ASCO|nr:hypothetical protein CANARDRAFT_20194 [[Candida] arabinofermentans NRRL YB-2248]
MSTRDELILHYSNLDYDTLLSRFVDLELDFKQYQSESKELEDFLESELTNNNNTIIEQSKQLNSKDSKINDLIEEKLELNKLIDQLNDKINIQQYELKSLNLKLVDSDIRLDSNDCNLRKLQIQYNEIMESYNDILEKNAILENQLNIIDNELNLKNNQIIELNKKCNQLTKITKLITLNRNELKISKFQTPPINDNNDE